MKPKEKAEYLIKKFYPLTYSAVHYQDTSGEYGDAKQCAIKVVDEIFNFIKMENDKSNICYWTNSKCIKYWKKVREEIENYKPQNEIKINNVLSN